MKKVIIGISGGVDSSVAALLLQKQGFEVIGVTFIFTDNYDTKDAEEVCKKLNIKHIIKDYRKEFKEKIIDQFISDYKNGLTPNPCVLCNKTVKVKYLFDIMEELEADFVATGHYGRIIDGKLYKSENQDKDQSYFLSQLTKEQLNHIILPLDNMSKEDVRKIASKNNLINADKKDSFDVCFITTNFKDYMASAVNSNNGPIINIETNEVIGEHSGLMYYTVGQRKGLSLGGNKERTFVVGKDLDNNILYVASGDQNNYLYSDSALVTDVNWINDTKPNKCSAKFRYRQSDNEVSLRFLDDSNILVKYPQLIKSVTPGQACVFYLNEECLGGGIIKEIYKNGDKIKYL